MQKPGNIVRKNKTIVFVIPLFLILISNFSFATNFYVDATNGNDDNPGIFPTSAWKSITKVNNSLFLPGDSILFKRGEQWREQLIVSSSGTEESPITIAAYGSGEKPLFLGSVAQNNVNDWTFLGENKWATANGSFPKIKWRSVGFMLLGDEAQDNVGSSVVEESDLDEEREFWWEEEKERVILFSPGGNPATVYGNIEVGHRHSCLLLEHKNHILIQDLAFKYSNNSAIMPDACNYLTIQYCEASFLGGGRGATTRAGDAIPPHGACSYIVIRDCNISQVFDVGIAPQLYPQEAVLMHNIVVENCIIDRCGAGITIAAHGAIACEIKDICFRNNVVTNSGYGWSGTDNSVHGKGIGIKEKHGDIKPDVHDIYIHNNVIDTYAFRGINAYEGNFHIQRNIVSNGTAEYIDGTLDFPGAIAINGGDFVAGNSPSIGVWNWDDVNYYDLGSYQAASGQEGLSLFQNPHFLDSESYNFHLLSSSPCIDAAADVGLSFDFDSIPVPQGDAPDIGAFENLENVGVEGLYNESINKIMVYPSPSHGVCTISIDDSLLSSSQEYQLCIFNLYGDLIWDITTSDKETTWCNTNLLSGIYFISVVFASGERHQREFILR